MTLYTNPAVIGLRTMARRLGLTRPLARLRGSRNYEEAFDAAMFSVLRGGDVVWDVGANVGYYTKRFAETVAPDGHVVAFEPFPATVERLRAHMRNTPNYTLEAVALGSEAGLLTMQAGGDDLGATSRIVPHVEGGLPIRIETGDGIIGRDAAPAPTVLKIDTEGFELDVLRGMSNALGRDELRAVFVEVHFGLLTENGQPRAPAEIEGLLADAGFVTRWVDPSHIIGERC